VGEIQQGYDGKVGWEKNPMTGLRELQGAELAQTALERGDRARATTCAKRCATPNS
jgi:hypothetical protein